MNPGMAEVPDAAARRRALDPSSSFIVQAPAGSGKTGLLIQRYLALLAHADEPEEIVAITFTRKAAAEMRERVLAALGTCRDDFNPVDPKPSAHATLTCRLAQEALQRDRQAGWDLADNPSRLRIQTLDALCASLVRQMPTLSEFGAQPETAEDASALYLEAVRATLERVAGDDAVAQDIGFLLEHLDNDMARIESLLADMLRQRDHWLRHVHHGRDRDALEAALGRVRREALQRVCGLFGRHGAALQREVAALARYAAAHLDERDGQSAASAGGDALPGEGEDDVAGWLAIAHLLLTRDGGWRRQHTAREGFPAGAGKAGKAVASAWKERARTSTETLARRPDGEALRGALHALRNLPPSRYTDRQWAVLGAITRLLPYAAAQLKLVFQAHRRVDFTEIAQGALRALGEADAPTDLALALDYRIRHLLIDEFQDTSISQYEFITRLTAGWGADEGRTLFLVGDPMQSIYRFREAEVGLFLRARVDGVGGVALTPLALSSNFRSQRGIVDWVNATFARVMPPQEDVALGAIAYTRSDAVRDPLPGPAVDVHPLLEDDHAGEAARVAEIVAGVRRDDPAADVAILVRNRRHLDRIIPRLREAGLRFQAIEIEGLGRRPVVQDLLALTRALLHPADRLAWLAVLRAPWCGLLLCDLHALTAAPRGAHGDDGTDAVKAAIPAMEQTVWELLDDPARMETVSPDGRARLARVREVLGGCLQHRCRQSLRTTVEAAWQALGGPGCIGRVADLDDAAAYLDHLSAHEQAGGLASLAGFEEGLARLYASPDLEAGNALQVMTIHKAKGLEFDHVIVPGLGRASGKNGRKLFLWLESPRAEPARARAGGDSDLLLAPIQETGAQADPIYAWLEAFDRRKARHEDERLLYVAATRARRRLYLLGATGLAQDATGGSVPRPPAEGTLLARIWPVLQAEFAAAARAVPDPDSAVLPDEVAIPVIDSSVCRLVSGWVLPAAPAGVERAAAAQRDGNGGAVEYAWAGEAARHVGIIVHRWLRRIAADGVATWSTARIRSLEGVFERQLRGCGLDGRDAGRVTAALARTLTDERGRWLLGPQEDARNEWRITAFVEGGYREFIIDRAFRDAQGRRWVVDYKTGGHEGAEVAEFLDREQVRYQPQLDRYAGLIRALRGGPVRCGLYFPLLAGWREWGDEG